MKIKLDLGDTLFDPISNNIGEIIKFTDHPEGKLITIRWRVQDHLSHNTEHFYKKVLRSIKKGEMEYSPKKDN